ncbi:hypothetical protein GCM10009021_32210 [Halarchaeum nitratireducens]|uniref:Uncharacterized protein n=2 Tax=Halobacteriaceae TaxID=2236 RepID=A0A830FH45_9EURY|nr:hypothetical protein GCM10009039_34940 [Halocalculus aciditolerans]GGM96015.1 hypothetical protein GCM10010106_51140 [Thermopolyspora flexuosa]GGN27170.1 hypothetical protein GCM10009021_32210 [Halarchaeum nitratireducens]
MGFPGLDWLETLGPGRTFGGGWSFGLDSALDGCFYACVELFGAGLAGLEAF